MKPKIIAIVGPTGSKKSYLALELAKYLNFNAQIISADAFQVYKEISVGINKPLSKELNLVKHHFINNISINENWNIKIFKEQAEFIINDLISKSILPIICGGSHLYIDVITKNYNLEQSPMRNRDLYKYLSNKEIYQKLYKLDPQEALKITESNRKRLIRALEIYETTGLTKNELIKNQVSKYNVLYIFCNINNRELLMKLLNQRTQKMFENHWVDEIKEILKKYSNFSNLQASKAIGYSYLVDCILNDKLIEIENLQKLVRQLAKRQITWCKNHYLENTIHYDFLHDDINFIFQQVNKFLKS